MFFLKKSAEVGVRLQSNSVLRLIDVWLMPDFAPASQPCAAAADATHKRAARIGKPGLVGWAIIDRDETEYAAATARAPDNGPSQRMYGATLLRASSHSAHLSSGA